MSDLLDNLQPHQKEVLKIGELKLSNGNKITIKEGDDNLLRGNTLDYIFVDNFEFEEMDELQKFCDEALLEWYIKISRGIGKPQLCVIEAVKRLREQEANGVKCKTYEQT